MAWRADQMGPAGHQKNVWRSPEGNGNHVYCTIHLHSEDQRASADTAGLRGERRPSRAANWAGRGREDRMIRQEGHADLRGQMANGRGRVLTAGPGDPKRQRAETIQRQAFGTAAAAGAARAVGGTMEHGRSLRPGPNGPAAEGGRKE